MRFLRQLYKLARLLWACSDHSCGCCLHLSFVILTIILFSVINISALHIHWHLLISFHILSSCSSDLLAIHALLVLPFQFGLFYFITVLFWLDSSTVFIKHSVKPLSQMTYMQLKKLSFITVHWQRIKLKKFLFKDLKDFFYTICSLCQNMQRHFVTFLLSMIYICKQGSDERRNVTDELEKLKTENTVLMVCII